MLSRTSARPAAMAIVVGSALACSGDPTVTGPPEAPVDAPTRNVAGGGAGQSAKLFIAGAFGDSVLRYEVTQGGGAAFDATIRTDPSPRGIAFSTAGEMFVANSSGSIRRFLDPENAATANGSLTAANTGAPFSAPQWLDFRSGELFHAQENGTVLRFTFDASGNAAFNGTLAAGGPARGVRAHPTTGELFVSSLGGSIQRFVFDASGNATPNGVISGGLSQSHGMALTPWGELLVANYGNSTISRFVFDAAGNAIPNGTFSGGDMAGPLDLDFAPWGELFVTNHNQDPGKVTRWLFTSSDAAASAVYNGSFTVPANMGVMRFASGAGTGNAPPAVATDEVEVWVDAGALATSSGTVSDPEGDPLLLTASAGAVVDNGDGTWSWSLDTAAAGASSQVVTITADDGNGTPSQATFRLVVNLFPPAKVFIGEAFGDEVFRFAVSDGGGALLDHTITTNVSEPGGIAFGPGGEMFVSNRTGSVARYLDPEGAATANGLITAAGTGAPFEQPHWLTFRQGELFLAQRNGSVLRFVFDAAGDAAFNGALAAGGETRGIQTNPATGEVLVSNLGNSIYRFLFDAAGNPTSNGLITGGGMNHIHAMTYTPWGELLVANTFGNSVSRFVFDASGTAIPNGSISGGDMAGPIDLDFSPWGELFVTNHNQVPGKVTRWTFTSEDASATAVYRGAFEIPANLGGIQFAGSSDGGGPPNGAPSVFASADPVTVDEGSVASNGGTASDPNGDPITLSASVGAIVDNGDGTWSWTFDTTDGPAESQVVTIDADDGRGGGAQTSFALVVNNVAPTVTSVSVPPDPVDIGSGAVSATATFTDPAGSADEAYTCTVDYGDGSEPLAGTVSSGTTCVGPAHTYGTPGVYSVSVAVADKDAAGSSLVAESFVVIYDPSGGFVTGGGWIDSPPGAYPADPLLTGKATFGFVSKYRKGATVPTGNTEFHFRAGGLEFRSSSYDWLVVTQGGANAQFKGSGSVNGAPSPAGTPYEFMIWAGDGSPDSFRLRIWYESPGEVVVYDNGFDQALGGGSIVVHSK